MYKDTLKLTGTFWSELNDDPAIKAINIARNTLAQQLETDLQIVKQCVVRSTTPIFHKTEIQPLTLVKETDTQVTWFLPDNVVRFFVLTDKLVAPARIWINKLDFIITNQQITFREPPFTAVDGNTLTLWETGAETDERYLDKLWGYPVDLNSPSSRDYRHVLELVYEILICGTTRANIERLVALFYNYPLAEVNETVVDIAKDSRGIFVATDSNIYRGPKNSQPIVNIGNQLNRGDSVFSGCDFYSAADTLTVAQLPAITLSKNILDHTIGAALTFENAVYPLTRQDNFVSFPVQGEASAVETFFRLFNKNGQAYTALTDETINPCEFVRKTILGRYCLVCVIKNQQPNKKLASIDLDKLLKRLVPPHELLLIIKV